MRYKTHLLGSRCKRLVIHTGWRTDTHQTEHPGQNKPRRLAQYQARLAKRAVVCIDDVTVAIKSRKSFG